MSKEKETEYAFAMPETEGHWEQNGMTLRDYFAGQALAGLSSQNIPLLAKASAQIGETVQESVSKLAYELADAMMEARND